MARNWRPFFDKNLEYAPRQPKEPPKGPKSPKGTPKAPKWTPKGSQMEPKGHQMDPKGSQMDPKGSQMEPKVAPRETKGAPKTPKGSQGDKIYTHKLPIPRPSGPLVFIRHPYLGFLFLEHVIFEHILKEG